MYGGASEMKEIARTQERDKTVEESELKAEVEEREGRSPGIKNGGTGTDMGGEHSVINPPV